MESFHASVFCFDQLIQVWYQNTKNVFLTEEFGLLVHNKHSNSLFGDFLNVFMKGAINNSYITLLNKKRTSKIIWNARLSHLTLFFLILLVS